MEVKHYKLFISRSSLKQESTSGSNFLKIHNYLLKLVKNTEKSMTIWAIQFYYGKILFNMQLR